jgi:O-antigen ligase
MSLTIPDARFAAPPDRNGTRSGGAAKAGRIIALVAGALVIAALPPTLSIAIIAGAALALVLLARPYGALCALAFAIPFESVRNIHAGSLNITVTNLIVFCLAAAWLTRTVSAGKVEIGPVPWRPALLIYGAVLMLSATQAIDFAGSIKELIKWAQLLFVYMAGVSIVRTPKQVRTLLIVLFAAVIAESMVGVLQTLLHAGPSSFARGALLRAAGTFEQPNPFAGYLNMTLPLAVACLIFRVFPRRYMWLVTLITAGGVLSSLSRGGELGTAAALIAIGLVMSSHVRSILAIAGIGLIGLVTLVAIGVVPSSVTEPVAQGFGVANVDVINPNPVTWSVAERLAHMEAGLGMYQDHPILGVGIGNYPAQYVHYQVAAPWGPNLGHAHNYYINIAAEAGTFGLIAFVILLVSACVICVRSYRRAVDPIGRAIAVGGLGVIVGFAAHQSFDDLFVHSMEVQIALVMTLVTVVGYGSLPPASGEPHEEAAPAT